MNALRPGCTVSFAFAGRRYVERVYERDGGLYATTDRPRYGDGPCDVLVRHADGSLNANVSDLRVVGAGGRLARAPRMVYAVGTTSTQQAKEAIMQNNTTHAQDFNIAADFQGVACTCGEKFLFGYPASPMEMLREHIVRRVALRAVAAHRRR